MFIRKSCISEIELGNITDEKEGNDVKTLREIMTTNVETVTLKDNVYEVAVKMRDHNVGIIPVVDEANHVIGLITDRDIVIRGLAEKREGSASVEQVMSNSLVVGRPDMTVKEASQLMADNQIRRLPVTENGKLVGIVAMADIAREEEFISQSGQVISEISETTGEHRSEQPRNIQ